MKRFMGIALVGMTAALGACGGPAMVNGKAVPAKMTVTVNFSTR